ncbi:MAG: hypothetical protein KKE11_01140, partial [Gammaproteobacteria bacterium]|nr:hypothetical protein [Gammaproteobacteria bacterium]
MNSEILPSSRIRDCILKSEKKPFNLFCLGCAVKVPLKTVVYPVLKKINQKLRKTKVSINISSDAFIFETDKKVKIKRCI